MAHQPAPTNKSVRQAKLEGFRPYSTLRLDEEQPVQQSPYDLYHGWSSAQLPPPERNLIKPLFEPTGMDPVTMHIMRLILFKLTQKPCVAAVIARKNFGKTVITAQLVLRAINANIVDDILWFSNTAYTSSTMKFLPPSKKVRGLDLDMLEKIMDFKTQLVDEAVARGANTDDLEDMRRHGVPHDIIVFDDCMGEWPINNPLLKRLVSQHRHMLLTVLLLNQSASYVITPDVKQNCDFVLLGFNNLFECEKMCKDLNFPGTAQEFAEFVGEHTRVQGAFLIYNNFTISTKPEDRWANFRPPFIDLKNVEVISENSDHDMLHFLDPLSSDEEEEIEQEEEEAAKEPARSKKGRHVAIAPGGRTSGTRAHRPRPPMIHSELFPHTVGGVLGVRQPWARALDPDPASYLFQTRALFNPS